MIMEKRARVISQEKDLYRIFDGENEKIAVVSGKYRYETIRVSDYPAVGDYVIATWPEGEGNAVINALFPRKTCFIRKAAGSKREEQVVASNIDTVFICMSLNSNFNLHRLERYITLTYSSGAIPVVVLTKADLCSDVEGKIAEVMSVAIGIDTIAVSSIEDDYSSILKYITKGKTIAFLGSSGVGKSTLINKLLGYDYNATGEIGDGDKGRHTTTRRELIQLDNGACLIDTPGMREVGLWNDEEGIESSFGDIEALSSLCRFSDCSHTTEPGCAVQKAILEGKLDKERYNSFMKLKKENLYFSESKDYLDEKKTKFKSISKINKASKKYPKY